MPCPRLVKPLLLSTNTIIMKSVNEPDRTCQIEGERLKKLEIVRQNTTFYNYDDFHLIPDDFHINISSTSPFVDMFKQIEMILLIIYISNTANIKDLKLQTKILGQRSLYVTINLNEIIAYNKELYNIYNWIFTEGNPIDKLEITRNVISLHCKYTSVFNLDDTALSSIRPEQFIVKSKS